MKFSEVWLREWVDPAIDTETLAEQITMAGLEVEAIEPVSGQFSGVVVGHVVECQQHPNADKLRITKVDVGHNQLLDIVCGAANCRQGLKVACALVGALLPGNFKIAATKLRDQLSQGMLCSYAELGIDDQREGIIELPADAPIGKDIYEYLQLHDRLIEISVTPNRADCLSLIGIARDVSVLNNLPMKAVAIQSVVPTTSDLFPVQIDAPQACPRYLGRVVKGINAQAETPFWIREKLRRCGIRPVDAVVDVTNFVLLELGQPMHAFDLTKLEGGIVVRMANHDETLTLLDGQSVTLSTDTLVIADQQRALALAGIFGGEYSGVNAQTEDVFLECAYFSPLAIAGRARQYGLRTEASYRYERGVDPQLQHRAMEYATQLLLNICGGHAGPIIDMTTQSTLPSPTTIILRREKLDRMLGYHIDSDRVINILTRLGCQITEQEKQWQVVTPSWRFDLALEEDLVEEIARIYGYHNIPAIPLRSNLVMVEHREGNLPLQRVKTLLVDRGYQEAITYSFVDPKVQMLLHPEHNPLVLPNPISVEMSVMRLSLWTGLLSTVAYNQNRQQSRIRLFECGMCFLPDDMADLGIRQETMLSGVITGNLNETHWDMAPQEIDFYDLKGDVEAILQLTGKLNQIKFKAESHSALHPGQTAAIYLADKKVGYIGVIHPKLEKKLGLNGRTIVFELQWHSLVDRVIPEARPISRFPANHRDIAIVVPEHITAESILAECRKVSVNQIVDVNLFDVYRGEGVAEGYKSLAISLVLQDTTRTLEENEIAAAVARCVSALQERFQASLRD